MQTTTKQPAILYEFFIFNERKKLLFYIDFLSNPEYQITSGDIEKVEKEHRNRVLNVHGIAEALKPFCLAFARSQITNVKYFRTTKYKYSIYESPSGVKLILLSTNDEFDFAKTLEKVYKEAYLDFVINNALYENGQCIDCPYFIDKIKEIFEDIKIGLSNKPLAD